MTLKAPIILNTSEAQIIRSLRKSGYLSRAQITEITGWSKAKTSQEVRSLLKKEFLCEIGEGLSEGGRKPMMLNFNINLGYIVGIDVGATSLDIALANVGGDILQHFSQGIDVRNPPEDILCTCTEIIFELAKKQGCLIDQILGIGVGLPGPVDFAMGTLVAPPLMPDWENYPIREFFSKTFTSAYVVVDNDVNVMALGEKRYGDAQNVDHFIFVKIGTGIGAGIISNSKIHRGSNGCAGDIGHICVDKEGPICRCGNRGCLEAMAAAPAITERAIQAAQDGSSPLLKKLMENSPEGMTPELVNIACREGDEAALSIIRASGHMIGDVLASLVNFFNPSHIFIGGGISNFGNHLLVSIRRAVLRRSLPLATTNLFINFSRINSDIGVRGVIALALEYLFVDENHPFLSI